MEKISSIVRAVLKKRPKAQMIRSNNKIQFSALAYNSASCIYTFTVRVQTTSIKPHSQFVRALHLKLSAIHSFSFSLAGCRVIKSERRSFVFAVHIKEVQIARMEQLDMYVENILFA